MVVSNDAHSWTVVFDAGRFSEYFDGVAQGEREAIVAAIQQARLVRDAREADFAPYLSIKFGTGPADMHGSTMPMTDLDLDLDDKILADQLRTGAAAERARDQSLHDAMIAAEQRGPTTSPTVATSVVEQLHRIGGLIGSVSPVAGAERPDIIAVESAQRSDRYEWPNELVELFLVDKPSDRLTPYGALYGVGEMVSARAQLIEVRDRMQKLLDYPELAHLAEWSNEPAGSPTDAFLDAFVPIAGDDREYVIVDLRTGDLCGSVSVYQREGDVSGPTWVSISAMLSDVADSLESGTVFDGVWVPTFSDSILGWDAP